MVLKIVGSLMILSASSFLGYTLSRECTRRPEELRELQGMLQIFENEISFMSNVLADAFCNVCKGSRSHVGNFFSQTAVILKQRKGINASDAWEMAVRNNMGKTALNKEDQEILISFGKMLGSSDLEGQIRNIRLTMNQLQQQEKKAEEAKKKSQSMYRNLGVLGGLAIIVILF